MSPDDIGVPQVTEKARLEATALVSSKVAREEAQIRVRRERIRSQVRDGAILVLVVIVAILVFRNATEASRVKSTVQHGDQANCNLYHDVGTIPLAPNTTAVGLHLIADFRNSYFAYDCEKKHGLLPPPDPRLAKYLSPEAK